MCSSEAANYVSRVRQVESAGFKIFACKYLVTVVGLELMVGTDVLTVRDANKPHAHQLRRISMTGSSSSHRDDHH